MLRRCILSLLAFLVLAPAATAQEATEAELLALQEAYAEAFAAEDVDALLETLHREGPSYRLVGRLIGMLWSSVQTHIDVISLRIIGTDGDYAFTRERRRLTSWADAPEETDDRDPAVSFTDLVVAYRRTPSGWRIWNGMELTDEPVE